MPVATENLVGQTFGEIIRLGDLIETRSGLHWFSGTHLSDDRKIWAALPDDDKTQAPKSYAALQDSKLPTGVLWYTDTPQGDRLVSSLAAGPLTPKQIFLVASQTMSMADEQSLAGVDVWWDEERNTVTWVGVGPYSSTDSDASTLTEMGLLMWFMATGTPYTPPVEQLPEIVPEPFPTMLAQLICDLIQKGKSKGVKDMAALAARLEVLALEFERSPPEETTQTRRQSTQELWAAQQGQHVGRAAGQPVFFIIGGLITAAVISLMGSLGFFAKSEPSATIDKAPHSQETPRHQNENKSE